MRSLAFSLAFAFACGGGGGGGDAAPTSDGSSADASDAGTDAAPDGGTSSQAPPTGHCHEGWCWVLPLPQGNNLAAIWGTSSTDIWVVGGNGTTMHSDGTSWVPYQAGSSVFDAQMQIWGTGTNNVFATFTDGIYRWDGTTWTLSNPGDWSYAIGGTAATDVWAFFSNPNIARQFDGTSWIDRPMPTPTGWRTLAIGGSTPGRPIVVAANGSVARWTGSAWAIVVTGIPLASAVVLDDTHIVATTGGGVRFWNGTTWATPPVSPPVGSYASIAATSYTDVWIAGYHFDGATWTAVPGDTTWKAAWTPGGGYVWTLSNVADVVAWDGASWQHETTAGDVGARAVWGTADSDLWILVEKQREQRTMHWNGTSWTEVPLPGPSSSYTWFDLWGSAADDYWLVGGKRLDIPGPAGDGTLSCMLHWNGTAWSESYCAGDDSIDAAIVAVWGSGPTDVYAMRQSGGLLHYDGTEWSAVPGPLARGIDVFGTAANDVYALFEGTSLHWDGVTWSPVPLPSNPERGWANSPTDVWFTGSQGTIHFDGTFATTFATGWTNGAPVGTATDVVVVAGWLWRWNGGVSATPTQHPASFRPPQQGWRSPSGRVFMTNFDGLLVHEP